METLQTWRCSQLTWWSAYKCEDHNKGGGVKANDWTWNGTWEKDSVRIQIHHKITKKIAMLSISKRRVSHRWPICTKVGEKDADLSHGRYDADSYTTKTSDSPYKRSSLSFRKMSFAMRAARKSLSSRSNLKTELFLARDSAPKIRSAYEDKLAHTMMKSSRFSITLKYSLNPSACNLTSISQV